MPSIGSLKANGSIVANGKDRRLVAEKVDKWMEIGRGFFAALSADGLGTRILMAKDV